MTLSCSFKTARPSFLQAGRGREKLSYFETRLTSGMGRPVVLVSYVGGTTGIPSSFVLYILAKVI